jgi:hypothetical protein
MTESELRKTFPAMVRVVHVARGALRMLRPHRLDQDVAAHVDKLSETEAIHRLLKNRVERANMVKDIRNETLAARSRAAGVALYALRDVQRYAQDVREWATATRRNASESFPNALDGVDRNGMIMLGMAREQVRARLAKAPASVLRETYINAQPRRDDPIALLETEIIESMLESGSLAASEADVTPLRELRRFVSDCQNLRLPTDLPDYEGLAADVDRLHTRARAAEVSVINPEDHEASAVFNRKNRRCSTRALGLMPMTSRSFGRKPERRSESNSNEQAASGENGRARS